MKIKKRKKLLDILSSISSEDEKRELEALSAMKGGAIEETLQEAEDNDNRVERLEKTLTQVLESFDSYRKASSAHSKYLVETFGGFSENMVKKLEELGGTITTSYEKNKPINAAGAYKDMINQLADVNKNIKDKPVPVWNWPQYASVSIRDTNFANVNPSIAPFNITAQFDEVQLSNYSGSNVGTVTYLSQGVVVAVLNLTYSGSNLIDVQRTN